MCVWITFFASLFYYSSYFCYYSWAPLHFLYYLWVPLLGVSTGQFGSGLCSTRNRPAHIGWKVEQLVVDRRQPQVESDRSPMDNGHVSQSQSEFQPPNLHRIFVGSSLDLLIFLWICVTTTGSKQKPLPQAQIWAKTSISSPNLSGKKLELCWI